MYSPEELAALNDRCEDAGARLFVVHDLQERLGRPIRVFKDDGMHVVALRHEPLECPWNRLIKRSIDVSVALCVAVCLLPWASLLVWLIHRFQSGGPLFFRQRRIGLHNEEFWIFKFRTMHVGATAESQQATNDDERIFPLGRWLRRMSIDELPQFLNVLRGEMSIVGPRPHLSEHDLLFARSTQAYRVRTFIKPGITGLAQVRGFRGETRTEQAIRARVQSDLHYVENWSPVLDWLIIFRTAWQMIRPPASAY
jgi:lipopolysaccharide/colanic/teichoic acid biosynthesis glycosyltransferase